MKIPNKTLLSKVIFFWAIYIVSTDVEVKAQNSDTAIVNNDTIGFFSNEHFVNTIWHNNITGIQEDGATNYNLSISDYLQGKVSGVDVVDAYGTPGRASQITLQGYSITGNHQSLIVIDGIPQPQLANTFNGLNVNTEDIHPLIPVALDDVTSIKILKNPTAVLLYGAEGADGAIIIETKKEGDSPLEVNYRYSVGFESESEYIELLNGAEYINYQIEALFNASDGFGLTIPEELAYDPNSPDFYNYTANTDWIKEVSQPGSVSNHYISFSGKQNKLAYHTSIDYSNNKGSIINTRNHRFLSRSKIQFDVNQKIKLGLNIDYAKNEYEGNIEVEKNDQELSVLELAFIKAPNMSVYKYDPDGNKTEDYFTPQWSYQNTYNPAAIADYGKSENDYNLLSTTLNFNYQITNWFQLQEVFNFNKVTAKSYSFLPFKALYDADESSIVEEYDNNLNLNSSRYRSETKLLFELPFNNKEVNSLNIQLAGIYQQQELNGEYEYIRSYSNSKYENKNTHYIHTGFASINYLFKKRYFFDISTRLESSSLKNSENNTAMHQGGNIGWLFSEEPFLKGNSILNKGNLSLGYSTSEYNDQFFYNNILMFMYSTRGFPVIGSMPLYDYNITALNLGLNLNFFNNKLIVEADYFRRNIRKEWSHTTFDILFVGLLDINQRSIDLAITGNVLNNNNMNWDVYWNGSFNRHYLEESSDSFLSERTFSSGDYLSRVESDDRIGGIYGLKYEGVYATDEDVIMKDQLGNYILDENGIPVRMTYLGGYRAKAGDPIYADINSDNNIDENDVQYLGNSFPKMIGGFGTNFRYKSFSFVANFHYKFGYEIINQVALTSESMNTRNNQSTAVRRRWRVPGDNGKNILPSANRNRPLNGFASDAYVESGDYIRLNNVSVGYSFKPSVCQKLRLEDLNIILNARNLHTSTSYSGLDPEIENGGWLRRDRIRNIPARSFTFSLQLKI